MVPLDDEAAARVLAWDDAEPRSVSLRHALIHRCPGLWGDHPRTPRSVLLVRDVDDAEGWHVFGVGHAEPAIGWLAKQGRVFSLLAPEGWEGAIRKRSAMVARGIVETWVRRDVPLVASTSVLTRPLTIDDALAFRRTAPDWALRGWGTFDRLLASGAAFGVPTRDGGFAAVAWVFEADHDRDSIAVATVEWYRRLGLGRAVGAALIGHVETVRRKAPLWTVADHNLASKALARSLRFSPRAREIVLRWSLGIRL